MDEGKNHDAFSGSANTVISEKIKSELKATKPWVRFMSILGFVSIAFGLFGMVGMSSMIKAMPNNVPGPPIALMVIMNLVVIIFYFFPAMYLFRYASSIGKLLKDDDIASLETALTYQKSFWRFVGVMVIVMFVLAIAMALIIPTFMKQMH